MVVLPGEVVAHGEALAGLLKDPRVATAALLGGAWRSRQFAYRVRSKRRRVLSAASPYHAVHHPTSTFLGVLKVAAADRPLLAEAAARLAELTEDPPEEWRDELGRKAAMWRAAQWRAANRPRDDEEDEAAGEEEPVEQAPEDVVLSADDEARLNVRLAAAPEDTTALLLTGLVRSGAEVGSHRLRKLFWDRPLSAEAVAEAQERIRDYDEDKVLLESAVKARDGFFTTFFVSTYSRYIARWAARRGLTPNQVTTFSLGLGLLAALGFASGERWGWIAGAVLLQAAFTTDCVDGQLARYTRTFSKLGAWLDSIFDRTKEYLVFAGLAIGSSRAGDPVWTLACAAITLQTVRHFSDFSYGASRTRVVHTVQPAPLERALDAAALATAARRERGPVRVETPKPPPARRPLPRRVLSTWHVIDRLPGVRWVKRMATFPIGERFAATSVTAALFDPRITFLVLLSWGGFAVVYTLSGRVLRSISAMTAVAAPGVDRSAILDKIAVYRDDGPLSRAIGRHLRLPPMLCLLLGNLAILALVAFVGRDASVGVAGAGVAWLVLTLGATSTRWPKESFHWSVPPLMRLGEYVTLAWLAAIAGAVPAAFALIAAVTFRHYDLVYRLRHRAEVPPAWLNALTAGWDGRVVIAWLLLALGLLPAAMYVWAALLGVISVAETVVAWRRFERGRRFAGEYDEIEGERDSTSAGLQAG
jgi:phosphatidylglycerophosphate synthase